MTDFAKLVLDADTKGLKSGEKALKDMGAQAGRTAVDVDTGSSKMSAAIGNLSRMLGPAVLAGAAITAGLALTKLVKNSIDVADDISKAAQKIGIGTEELSRLRYAADLAGLSFEGLQGGVRILSRNMFDAASGGKEAAAKFARLGISVQNSDGTLRKSSEVLGDLAEILKDMPDGAQKTALMMDLLGRSGSNMIPLLNGGRDALNAAMAEADKFGIVIDDVTGRRAEAFNDNISRMQGVLGNLGTVVAAEILPVLVELTNALIRNAGFIRDFASALSSAIIYVVNVGRGVGELASRLNGMVAGAANAANAIEGFRARVIRSIGPVAYLVELLERAGARAATRDAVGLGAAGTMKGLNSIIADSGVIMGAVTDRASAFAGPAGLGAVAGGAGKVKEQARKANDALRALEDRMNAMSQTAARLRSDLGGVLDNLFPDEAQFRRQMSDIDVLFRARKAGILSENDLARSLNAANDNMVSDSVKSLMDHAEEFKRELFNRGTEVEGLSKKVGDSFETMADRALTALDRLANGIRNGDFLSILSGVLSVGLELGKVGAFGGKVKAQLNTSKLPSADGGGFTGPGPRSGGVDGKGGFMAVLHPNETVIDHTKGGKSGGNVVVINNSALADVYVDGKIAQAAPAIANGGANVAQSRMARQQSRRVA